MSQLSLLCLACAAALPMAAQTPPHWLSGPYTHENLSVFLIHGATQPQARKYLTLQEALDQKKILVHETGTVGELAVQNVSPDEVFIQGGDIVKGGQQDRVISNDFVLPSKSGKVPVASFCVEQGRWSQRGNEPAQFFSSSASAIPTKQLKMAVKSKNQSEVWAKVRSAQTELAPGVAGGVPGGVGTGMASVTVAASPTSLQLTLEEEQLGQRVEAYIRNLGHVASGHKDVIGYAFAINGELNSADLYASPELFAGLWTKLLKASAVEAVSKYTKDKRFTPPPAAAVSAMLGGAGSGKASSTDINRRVRLVQKETDKYLLFESRDGAGWVHRNYILK